jgi:serine/threonine-protein kinase
LQEVLYRALERDPKNRYARAHDFARDLQHLDEVGVADRPELRGRRKRTANMTRRIILFVLLVLIPVAILMAMVLLSHGK